MYDSYVPNPNGLRYAHTGSKHPMLYDAPYEEPHLKKRPIVRNVFQSARHIALLDRRILLEPSFLDGFFRIWMFWVYERYLFHWGVLYLNRPYPFPFFRPVDTISAFFFRLMD